MSSGTSTNLGGTSPNSTVASSFLNYSPYSNTANTASLPSSSMAGSGGITSGLTGSLIGSSGMPALPTPGNYTRQTVAPAPAATAATTQQKLGNLATSKWTGMSQPEQKDWMKNNRSWYRGADR